MTAMPVGLIHSQATQLHPAAPLMTQDTARALRWVRTGPGNSDLLS